MVNNAAHLFDKRSVLPFHYQEEVMAKPCYESLNHALAVIIHFKSDLKILHSNFSST